MKKNEMIQLKDFIHEVRRSLEGGDIPESLYFLGYLNAYLDQIETKNEKKDAPQS